MKKALGFLAAVLMIGCLAWATGSAKSTSITGWVSDSACGAKAAHAGAEACTKTCVEKKGAKLVVVDDKDQKVYNVANQDSLKGHEGHHVTVTGTNSNGTLHIDKVTMVAANTSTGKKNP